jgi:hypothetical protein
MSRAASAIRSSAGAAGFRGVAPRILAAAVGLVVGCVGLVASADASKFVHREVAAGPGTGKGQFNSTFVADVAVNRSAIADGSTDPLGSSTDGYVYMVDENNRRVKVFSADGAFQFMWGRGVLNGANAAQVCDRTAASCLAGVVGVLGGMFNTQPQGIAIDQDSGHVFVRETGRVQEFEADGTFVRMWGWNVVVEGTTHDTATDQLETCFVATECKAPVTGSAVGQFGNASNVRIDIQQSTGDILAADPTNRRIQRFTVPANPVDPIPTPTVIGSSAQFSLGQPIHVAVDDGMVYASEAAGGNQIVRYDLNTASFLTPIPVATLTGTSAGATTAGMEIDALSGDLYVARDEAPPSGGRFSPVLELGNPDAPAAGNVTHIDTHVGGTDFRWRGIGLDPDAGDLYVAGLGPGSTGQRLFAAHDGPAPAAGAVFLPASGVSAIGATLSMSIDPNGSFPVEYEIQIASSSDPGDYEVVGSGQVPAGAPTVVSTEVSGLRPKTLYLVRLVTRKPFGNPAIALDGPVLLTKTAAPSLVDVSADSVEDTGARLRGRIDPNGTGTRYRFDYGIGGFQHSIPVPDASVGSGYGHQFVSERLSDLQPATTYQYRLVAISDDQALGATTSPTETFTTLASPSADERVFELVSPADKFGGQGTGFWPNGLGHIASSGVASHVGDRFIAMGLYGSVLTGDGAFGLNTDMVFTERVGDEVGWRGRPVITHPNYAPVIGQTAELVGAASDLSGLFWSSPSTLALFPELAGGSGGGAGQPSWVQFDAGLLSDWGGPLHGPTKWELFGPRGMSPADIVASSVLPAPTGALWTMAISGDGSTAYGMPKRTLAGHPIIHGLAGLDDPTGVSEPGDPTPPLKDLVSGRSVYRADLSGGLSDSYGGVGERELVNVCTGEPGPARTVLPEVAGGMLGAGECPAGIDGRERLVSDRGASFSHGEAGRGGVVSENGSRVFFLAPDPLATGAPNGTSAFCSGSGASTVCPPQLFVRQRNDDGSVVTRWVSKAQDGLLGEQQASLTGSVRFEGASKDGNRVYFRTNSPLTVDDPNGAGAPTPGGVKTGTPNTNSWDLYVFELADGADPTGSGAVLTRVSAGPDSHGDCNSPRPSIASGRDSDEVGGLRFVSDDGTRAYFTCQAPLPGVPPPADGARVTAPGGTPTAADAVNLYLFDANRPQPQRWRFVGRLPRATGNALATCASTGTAFHSPFNAQNGYHPSISENTVGSNCVRGSSDGLFVTLFTPGQLTLDDPPGGPVADIYGYDAESDELVRITAPQGGEEASYTCLTDDPTTSIDESLRYACRGDGGIDAHIGAGGMKAPGSPGFLGVTVDPLTAGERVAFFESRSRLVAEDLDDGYDVYEWRDGRLSLITSGAGDSKHAFYKGNDRTGRNVYVATQDRLSWQDSDAVVDVYSARVGGGIPEPVSSPVCTVLAGGCQGDGASGVPSRSATSAPVNEGNADAGDRKTLAVGALSRKARLAAARSGILRVSVRSSAAGRVVAVAQARIGGLARQIARGAKRMGKAGSTTLRLRLSGAARRELHRGKVLRVSVSVRSAGARSRSVTVRLPGVGS